MSSPLALDVADLSKKYGDRMALSHANFEVPMGSICGFVGPNGSGKTTTIRMLLGLITPTTGGGHVLGESITEPEKYLPRVGAMIEGPAFIQHFLVFKTKMFWPELAGSKPSRLLDCLI